MGTKVGNTVGPAVGVIERDGQNDGVREGKMVGVRLPPTNVNNTKRITISVVILLTKMS